MKARSALPLLLCLALLPRAAFAQTPGTPGPVARQPTTTPTTTPDGADHPAVANTAAPGPGEPITEKWWFWTAVTGVIFAGVVVAIVATRPPSAPRTTLGNMDAFGKP